MTASIYFSRCKRQKLKPPKGRFLLKSHQRHPTQRENRGQIFEWTFKWTQADDGGLTIGTLWATASGVKEMSSDAKGRSWTVAIVRTLCYMGEVTARELKNLRELLGMSQREFAKILKVSHMTVQRGELRGPSRTLVLLIERALADGTLRLSKSKSEPE